MQFTLKGREPLRGGAETATLERKQKIIAALNNSESVDGGSGLPLIEVEGDPSSQQTKEKQDVKYILNNKLVQPPKECHCYIAKLGSYYCEQGDSNPDLYPAQT